MRIRAHGLGPVFCLLFTGMFFSQRGVAGTPLTEARTAGTYLPAALAAAADWAGDARLIALESDGVDVSGIALEWYFLFYSNRSQEYKAFRAASGGVVTVTLDDRDLPDAVSLPVTWIDSDSAAIIAEDKGGRRFRTEHPGAELFASLHTINLSSASNLARSFSPSRASALNRPSTSLQPFSVDDNDCFEPLAIWFFFYYSLTDMSFFDVAVNARTGAFLFDSDGFTARHGLNKVIAEALTWAPDAELAAVATPSVSQRGLADEWTFTFVSGMRDSLFQVRVIKDLLFRKRSLAFAGYLSVGALPRGWIDSDAAAATVMAAGRQFVAMHPDARSDAALLSDVGPDRNTVWRFRFLSPRSKETFEVHVDAEDGHLITDVHKEESPAIPGQVRLRQNYPNPFNPATAIEYDLAATGPVTLTVFNLLGQKVRRLVHAQQSAGVYRAVWNGRDQAGVRMPPGIYVYRLEASGFILSHRMVLLP